MKKFFLTLLFCAQAHAGGVCLYEIGTADLRLASAGYSARAEDPSTLFTNPAGMARLCDVQLELGLQPIYSHANFKPNAETDVIGSDGSANIWLPAGSFFYVQPCTEDLTVGFGSLGYFGSDLVYHHDWVGRYYCQKSLMEALSVVPAAAYRINDQWSIGAGVNVMYGFFKQRAAINNINDALPDGYFTLRDYRFSCGGVFGVLYEPTCSTRLGIQYLTPVRIDFKSRPHFHDLGPILEEILTLTGVIGATAKVHINVPQSVMFSVYHDLNPCWSVMGNLGWQQWSQFQRVTFTLADENSTSITSKVKYKDTWHAALGVEWHYNCDLTFSGGIAYDSSCISNKERPLDLPVGKQWRFGTGARWAINDALLMDVGAELLWSGDLKADVNKGRLAGHVSGVFKGTCCAFFSTNFIYTF